MLDPNSLLGDVMLPPPWREVTLQEVWDLSRQLAREVTALHPLAGRVPRVIARCYTDDILLRLSDGTLAETHLQWEKEPSGFCQDYPTTIYFSTDEAFNDYAVKGFRKLVKDLSEEGDTA